MKKTRYFDKLGTEISDDDAFDRNGALRNGFSMRVPLTMRDALAGTGSHGPRGQQPDDICTIDGKEGRLRNVNGELQCVPLKSQDATPLITDGRSTDLTALHRPGFRVPVINDRRAVYDAYARYERQTTNSFKLHDGETQCPDCDGEGEVDGDTCETCNGKGVVSKAKDSKEGKSRSGSGGVTLDRHRQTMSELYDAHDRELANAWRQR